MVKKWLAFLCLCALCVCIAGGAEASFFPDMDWDTTPVEVTARLDVSAHMPFDETRTGYLNDWLKHVSLTLRAQQMGGEAWGQLSLAVDDAEALRITQCEDEQASQVQLSLLPDTTYTMPLEDDAALNVLLGQTLDDTSSFPIGAGELSLLADGEEMLAALLENERENLQDKAEKQTVNGYGTTTRRITLNVSSEDAENFGALLSSLCPAGSLKNLLEKLTFSGKQTMYWLAEDDGAWHKFNFTGRVTPEGGTTRKVTLTWRMARTEEATKDQLTLKSPSVSEKESDKNTLTLKRTVQDRSDGMSYEAEFEYAESVQKVKRTLTGEAKLTRKDKEDGINLSGDISIKEAPEEGSSQAHEFEINLLLDDVEQTASGTVAVTEKLGGKVQEAATVSLYVQPCDYFSWELRESTVALNLLDETQLSALRENLAGAAAKALIRPLVLLPKEDTLYFSKDLSDEAWDRIVNAAMRDE